ncbi:MAG: hypothetical protein GZ086_05645 [Gelidibacter sp.]|nr:hypothetical protein [Gelidibacter sp.]
MKQLIYIILGFYAISAYSQSTGSVNATFNLSQVALLDLEPDNTSITANLSPPIEAGEKVSVTMTNNTKWINFSSAVLAGNSRSISIQLEAGQKTPPGIYLKLTTSSYSGINMGNLAALGSPAATVTLNNTPQPIISGIKGSFTGNGINNGYKLTYALEIYDYKLLDFNQTASLSITLTLSDL